MSDIETSQEIESLNKKIELLSFMVDDAHAEIRRLQSVTVLCPKCNKEHNTNLKLDIAK